MRRSKGISSVKWSRLNWMKLLLLNGSLRAGSVNGATLRTVEVIAPTDIDVCTYTGLADLPSFNPDEDQEPLPSAVQKLRDVVAQADALLICTPEYAGALPGSFKNLLDWLVGSISVGGKPVAWLNVSGPAAPRGGQDAHDSLRLVLIYLGVQLVEAACRRLPLTRSMIGADGLIADPNVQAELRHTLDALQSAL